MSYSYTRPAALQQSAPPSISYIAAKKQEPNGIIYYLVQFEEDGDDPEKLVWAGRRYLEGNGHNRRVIEGYEGEGRDRQKGRQTEREREAEERKEEEERLAQQRRLEEYRRGVLKAMDEISQKKQKKQEKESKLQTSTKKKSLQIQQTKQKAEPIRVPSTRHQTQNLKIIRAYISQNGVTSFQVKYADSKVQWVGNEQLRAHNPRSLIKFYEKKARWNN